MTQSMPTSHAKRYKLKNAEVFVEACRLGEDNASEVSNWANGAQIVEERDPITGKAYEGLNVRVGGDRTDRRDRASLGDMIVKFQGNELQFAVLKPGEFAKRYVEAPL